MYGTINLPGSQHFDYYGPAPKAECEEWILAKEREHKDLYGGAWASTFLPARIVPNKEAERWKYRDGRRVIRGEDGC